MGLMWLLMFLACSSCCLLLKAEEYDNEELNDDSSASTESSLHGFRPCLDESCSAVSLDSESELSWNLLSTLVRVHKSIYQTPDSVTHDPDVIVEYCMPLHTSTVDNIASIEERHPDIKDVKMKVIEDFIRLISDFALLNTTNCDSSMSLIGYISLAVRSLEVEYSEQCGELCNCVYTAGVEEYMASTSTTDSPTTESIDQSTSTFPPLGDEGYRTPCPEDDGDDSYEEIYAEDLDRSYGSSMLVGSIKGVPGVNFPNYTEIPLTSFSCADKKYIPGFYADVETGCQVFHVCYEHRRESFLCPLGTIFNQPILACDYWYSSDCSLAKDYYEVNVKSEEEVKEEAIEVIKELIEEYEEDQVVEEHTEATDEVYEATDSKHVAEEHGKSTDIQAEIDIRQFLPVKAKVIDFEKPEAKGVESIKVGKQESPDVQEFASQIFDNIILTATDIASKARAAIDKIPEPDQKQSSFDSSSAELKPVLSAKKLAGVKSAIPATKLVMAKKIVPLAAKAAVKAAIPVAAVKTAIPVAAKVAAVKTAIPVAAKVAAVKTAIPVAAKVAAAKTAIPVAAKVVAAKTAIPVAAKVSALKATIPIAVKTKLLAAPAKKAVISGVKLAAAVPKFAFPLLKPKLLVPAMKGKVLKAAAVPVLKAKILPVKGSLAGLAPVAKAKLVKAAAISPLTKKTLALGYMKLLKAKKLALMG